MTVSAVRNELRAQDRPMPTFKQLEILGLIHQRGGATVAEIQQDLSGEGLRYTSVLTMCQTLEKNGWVNHSMSGKAYVYQLAMPPKYIADRFARLLVKAFPEMALQVAAKLKQEPIIRELDSGELNGGG